ncbi:MAG: response regulator transcription factor [Rubrobacteraceae bacterium]
MPEPRETDERAAGDLPEKSGALPAALEVARSLPPRAFAFTGIAIWCFLIMVISLNLAVTSLHWVSIAAFGVLLPFALIFYANHVISSHEAISSPKPEDKERELLEVLGERGELTPTLAAMKTSLTVREASGILEELSKKGYLEMRGEEGIMAYSLWERDLRQTRSPQPDGLATGRASSGVSRVEQISEALSERELEVLALLASGKSNREIAGDLFVATGTVKTHTNNIYRKLGANNRADALARARALEII